MVSLEFHSNLPSPEEFRETLVQAMAMANPVDDLLALADRLREYEHRYHMESADFYRRYQAGTLDEELQHCVEWAALYGLFLKIKSAFNAPSSPQPLLPRHGGSRGRQDVCPYSPGTSPALRERGEWGLAPAAFGRQRQTPCKIPRDLRLIISGGV